MDEITETGFRNLVTVKPHQSTLWVSRTDFVAGVKLLEMAHKRKRVAPSRASGLIERLIQLKVKCNFSVKQLQQVISLYQPSEEKTISKLVRKELREDYSAYRLHGCSQCEEYIWIAGEKQPCDVCQNQDGRSV